MTKSEASFVSYLPFVFHSTHIRRSDTQKGFMTLKHNTTLKDIEQMLNNVLLATSCNKQGRKTSVAAGDAFIRLLSTHPINNHCT